MSSPSACSTPLSTSSAAALPSSGPSAGLPRPPGGCIGLSLETEGGTAVVRVSDTGFGIPREAVGHIFEKFYQADSSHATQGNGLGLALVRRVMDIAGGEISVESEPGRGSVFSRMLESE